MTTFLYISIVAEMLIVNLSTVNLCAKRKYSSVTIMLALLVYSMFIVFIGLNIINKFPSYGNGNGAFVLAGFLYLPLLKILYEDSFIRILELLCSAWIYTMLTFTLSVHISKMFDPKLFAIVTFTVQTVIYLCTYYFFRKFIGSKFIYIIQNISSKTHFLLLTGSVLWFITLVTINIAFVDVTNEIFKIIALFLLGSIALVTYCSIYELTRSNISSKIMEKIANTDYLTSLPNRYNLSNNINKMIDSETPFSVFFIDLNKFKSVNDRFGHLVGDRYIVRFVECINKELGNKGSLYRVSGDEFLFLTSDLSIEKIENTIRNIYFNDKETTEFLGVSMGIAHYPIDGNTFDALLGTSDKRMYEDKNKFR